MKVLLASLWIVFLATFAVAQSPSSAKPARAEIEGLVVKDPAGEPVKKALIELIAENQSEGGNYTAVTGADGTFHIESIAPGRYHLFAERTGFLETDKNHPRSQGRVLTLVAGQSLKDLRIRLQAAAVVQGRVTDEDGDPMPAVQVSLLRQTFIAGRKRWEQARSERTNDLGEYRIAGLAAGEYYLSVSPPPDFKSMIEDTAGRAVSDAHEPASTEKTEVAYQTTYYPGTVDRGQATPVQLHAGDDFPVNFSLAQTASLSVRGSVVNLPAHTTAAVILQSRDFGLVETGADVHKDGSFLIRDVSPGAYTIVASVDGASVPLVARQTVQVSASVDGLRLAPQAGAWIHGRLRLESKENLGHFDPTQLFLALRSADGDDDTMGIFTAGIGFSPLAHVASDGSFEWKSVTPGNYYLQLDREGSGFPDLFLKSVLIGGRDLDETINVNGGAIVLDLLASTNGAVIDGVVSNAKGEPVANAVIVAVPEARLRKRIDRYRKTVSDQSGRFTLHGLPPGDYTVLAWESVDGDAYYNPEFVKSYEGQGIAVKVSEGEKKSAQLTAIPDQDE
jgi:hypothetical protein